MLNSYVAFSNYELFKDEFVLAVFQLYLNALNEERVVIARKMIVVLWGNIAVAHVVLSIALKTGSCLRLSL